MFFSGMSMGIKVAELNTLSDGKAITGIRLLMRWKIQMKSTNLRKLAEVLHVKESLLSGTSQQKRCQCHSNHS